jgi:tetratricopeptide (TPR) repeat protein
VAGVAALGGWQVMRAAARREEPAPAVAALMEQAELALRQGTREGQTQAIGLYQKVVADDPDYADGWASLGIAYAFIAHYRSSATARVLQQRAREAARRAQAIDRGNVLATVALATARPTMGNWRQIEAALLDALAQQKHNRQ